MALVHEHTKKSTSVKRLTLSQWHFMRSLTWSSLGEKILKLFQGWPWKRFVFNYEMLSLQQKETMPIVSSSWIEQLLIVSRIRGPSHFECQPYWLPLITPHSMFVYGGNESLTNRGSHWGEWLHEQWIVMILHLRKKYSWSTNTVSSVLKLEKTAISYLA